MAFPPRARAIWEFFPSQAAIAWQDRRPKSPPEFQKEGGLWRFQKPSQRIQYLLLFFVVFVLADQSLLKKRVEFFDAFNGIGSISASGGFRTWQNIHAGMRAIRQSLDFRGGQGPVVNPHFINQPLEAEKFPGVVIDHAIADAQIPAILLKRAGSSHWTAFLHSIHVTMLHLSVIAHGDKMPFIVIEDAVTLNVAHAGLRLQSSACGPAVRVAAQVEAVAKAVVFIGDPVPKTIPIRGFNPGRNRDVIRIQGVTVGNDDSVRNVGD